MLQALDWTVLAAYFAAIAAIAWWSARKRDRSPADYFLAGRHVGWFVVGTSIFASNVGSEHIVGLAGAGASSGVVLGHYELHSYLVLLLGWVFVPFYLRSAVFTMPEFLERRFGPGSRWLLSLTMLVAYVLTKVSVTIYAGAIVFEQLMGIEFWTGAVAIVALTGVYTVVGGMRAVVYTEALQAIVLILGSVVVTVAGLARVGGPSELAAAVGPEKLDMWLPLDHPEYPWLGLVLAAPIVGLWYWCTDQYIVQRVLAARNEREARRGAIFAAALKLLPFFIFLVPGLIALALAQRGELVLTSADAAFPTLVQTLLPDGLRGLVAGGLLAALMSSLAAVFNSASTLFTIDVYQVLRPRAAERELVRVGRASTVVLVALGLAWIPILTSLSGALYGYLQQIQVYLAPPIAAVFLLGVFAPRVNATAAFATLALGFALGLARLLLVVFRDAVPDWLAPVADFNFLYFAAALFALSVVLLVGISLATKAPDPARLRGLTYATTAAADRAASRASWNALDVVLSLAILAAVIGTFAWFA